MIKSVTLALSTVLLLGVAAPVFAQDDTELVSDEVDHALWCGAIYATVTQIDGMSEDQVAVAEEKSTYAFAQAKLAMDEDGIEESEYERLIGYYTDMAVEELTTDGAEMRYTPEECDALIGWN